MRRIILLPLALCCFLLTSPSAVAFVQDGVEDDGQSRLDSPGLVVEAMAGWDGLTDQQTPVPISVLLSNVTSSVIEGDLVLSDPSRGTEVFLGEIVLAPQSTRRFGAIRDLSGWLQCFVSLRSRGDTLFRRELAVSTGHSYQVNENFALLVDDGGRRLMTANKTATGSVPSYSARPALASKDGRPVRNLNVKTWQLPDHPGPLYPIHAVIFPEAAQVKEVNKNQWKALASWICQGGTVFFHKESADVLQSLTEASPLNFKLIDSDGGFTVREMGLGSIREFDQPLFTSTGTNTRKQISDSVGLLSGSTLRNLLAVAEIGRNDEQTEGQLNRVYVAAFFGIYTLLTGLFTLMMFRFSKRTVGIYILTVVGSACLLAAVLGGLLRRSRGDLRWVTITQPGAEGLVQVSRIEVQSAGGSTDAVAVKGPARDLQYTGRIQNNYRYYGYGWRPEGEALVPFTLKPNLLGADAPDSYGIRIGMTPWGQRKLEGVGLRPGSDRLEFKIQHQQPEADGKTFRGRHKLTVEISNPTSMSFGRAWLVVGVTKYATNGEYEEQWDNYGRPIVLGDPDNQLIDRYDTIDITLPARGGDRKETIFPDFGSGRSYGPEIDTPAGWLYSPRLARAGTASAWIIAQMPRSPVLQIDTAHTEFTPQDGFHLFVQEIRPEDMPDAKLFLGPKPKTDVDDQLDGASEAP